MDGKRFLKGAVVTIAVLACLALAIRTGRHHLGSPKPTPMEQMPVLPLPADLEEARYVVEVMGMGDRMAGMSKEACSRRHQQRLKQLAEIEKRVADG